MSGRRAGLLLDKALAGLGGEATGLAPAADTTGIGLHNSPRLHILSPWLRGERSLLTVALGNNTGPAARCPLSAFAGGVALESYSTRVTQSPHQ